jgi:hypothetical protein
MEPVDPHVPTSVSAHEVNGHGRSTLLPSSTQRSDDLLAQLDLPSNTSLMRASYQRRARGA